MTVPDLVDNNSATAIALRVQESVPEIPAMRAICVGGMLVITAVFWVCSCHLPMRISEYQGDGEISNTGNVFIRGFKVDFETFSLARRYQATYTLEGLPKHQSLYQVGIVAAIPLSEEGMRPRAFAGGPVCTLSLDLEDASQQPIFTCKSPLNELDWRWRNREAFGAIYDPHHPGSATSSFSLEAEGDPAHLPGRLQIRYEPADNAPDIRAFVRIRVGGEK